MNKEQKEACEGIVRWYYTPDTVTACLQGAAGTGKSYTLKHIIEALKIDPSKIAITAPTHKAKKIASNFTGLQAVTIQKLLGMRPDFDLEEFNVDNLLFGMTGNSTIGEYSLVIVDECSMVNAGLATILKKKAQQFKTKILYLGDYYQLPPVKSAISPVFETCDVTFKLETVVRQSHSNPILEVLNCLRSDIKNKTDNWREFLKIEKSVLNDKGEGYIVTTNKRKFLNDITQSFKSKEEVKVLAHHNDSVFKINQMVRKELNLVNKLTMNELLTGYSSIFKDDVMLLENSEDYKVVSIKDSNSRDSIQCWKVFLSGAPKELKIVKPESYEYFRDLLIIKLNKAIKEKGKAWKSYYDFKNQYLLLEDFIVGNSTIATKDLDYGYGITVYKSQGSSIENVFVNGIDLKRVYNKDLQRRLLYVALSRAKKKTTILI